MLKEELKGRGTERASLGEESGFVGDGSQPVDWMSSNVDPAQSSVSRLEMEIELERYALFVPYSPTSSLLLLPTASYLRSWMGVSVSYFRSHADSDSFRCIYAG
jgi:hypothetical protein